MLTYDFISDDLIAEMRFDILELLLDFCFLQQQSIEVQQKIRGLTLLLDNLKAAGRTNFERPHAIGEIGRRKIRIHHRKEQSGKC